VTDIFNTETNSEETNSDPNAATRQQADIFVEKLLEIKREDGTPKYESVEAALDAIKFQNDHIRQIEADNAALKAKADEVDRLNETLERITKEKNVSEVQPGSQTSANGGLNEEAATKLIEQKLAEKEQLAVVTGNVKAVQDKLIQKYGTKEEAQKMVLEKAKELGMSADALKNLAATAPNAVLAFFGEAKASSTSVNASSTYRVPNSAPTEELKRPEKSILSGPGATTRNQTDFAKRVRENVYKRMDVQT
jgi:hypothetical protein